MVKSSTYKECLKQAKPYLFLAGKPRSKLSNQWLKAHNAECHLLDSVKCLNKDGSLSKDKKCDKIKRDLRIIIDYNEAIRRTLY